MKKFVLIFAVACISFPGWGAQKADITRWEHEAQNVTIIRDNWGIAHVYGKTDADAVFGMEYAQAEDDFNRVETNYINAMGRLAETEGKSAIYQDLRMKLFIDPETLKKQYAESPAWLKTLMNAFAGGLNYYLYKHPEVKPKVIKRFEPWMALSFSEGSIGGDIERVNITHLADFYGHELVVQVMPANRDAIPEPTGSNGMAIAPSNTVDHHALLLINPHTSFYFRSELQMASDQGLDAYGAVTWGQFFIYQGFNPHVGWMHTSSGVDAVDEYLETVEKKDGRYYYKYGNKELPVIVKQITVPYITDHGMAEKKFTTYYTEHGPVIGQEKGGEETGGEQNGKWLTIRLMQEPIKALVQSYTRTKATDFKSFLQTMELRADSSNNTIFADSDGDIAYYQANFIPKRDNSFDFTKPVDGSNPATDWHGLLSLDETPHLLNPKSGWIYNSNDAPWNAAGIGSLKKADFPLYVEKGGESARGLHAVRVLGNKKDFTLDSLIGADFDSYLPWFEKAMPALIKAWDQDADSDPLKAKLAEQIAVLRKWDYRWGVDSIPTSLAVFWGEDMMRRVGRDARTAGIPVYDYVGSKVHAEQLLQSLAAASDRLTGDFGTWKTPWGNINRFQRLDDDIFTHFDDSKPSIPVEFTSSTWGSLASFGARPYPNTKKWYGTSGNSFVAVVEFGKTVRARAVTAGGESGNPASPHFDDEAERYSTGNLREVYFYREQLKGHTERTYHPGD
ncbi:MAG TPA: penicillin acylase family protein [Candidatus Acidoferrales bacterium]|nr:penicillin acylase family protein [Candidatus Acidoferrales bacterium]